MWLIKVSFVILILHANYCLSLRQCCPNTTNYVDGSNCTNNSKILLYCPHGMYKLDPNNSPSTDNFTLYKEELEIIDNLERMQEHRFCLTVENGTPIALVCFGAEDVEGTGISWRPILFGILYVISALFLYITLGIYAALPELRDLQGKIMMSAMSSLLGAYVLLAMTQLNLSFIVYHEILCKLLAFSLYYCCLAAFFWSNLVAANLWRSVWFNRTLITEDTLFLIYNFIGWGSPMTFAAIALLGVNGIGNISDPGFGVYNCWFAETHETWVYLFGPVACLMTLNIVYFSLTCYELWHRYRGFTGTKLRVLRFKCLLYLKLLLVMGVTWIFEVISYATGHKWLNYWLVTDALNSLQGLTIFILLIATRKRVRKLLSRRKPFGITFPKSWNAGEDEEGEDVAVPDEELELSQAG